MYLPAMNTKTYYRKAGVIAKKSKGLLIHAWMIMTCHIHMVISCSGSMAIPDIMRDMKKYTATALLEAMAINKQKRVDVAVI